MDIFEVIEVPKIMGEGRSFQAHFPDGEIVHGTAANEEKFREAIRARQVPTTQTAEAD